MTLGEFCRHLIANGCEYKPIEGINTTGSAIRAINPTCSRKQILQVYYGGELSDTTIMEACDQLMIKYPPHLSEFME